MLLGQRRHILVFDFVYPAVHILFAVARNRECPGEDAVGHDKGMEGPETLDGDFVGEMPEYVRMIVIGEDKRPATPLGHTVVRGVDDTPLHTVALFIETPEHDREVPAGLLCRGADEPVHILQQDHAGAFFTDDVIYLPPELTLASLDTGGALLGDGVVLAREAANEQIVVRDKVLHKGDILIDVVFALPKVGHIAPESILLPHGRFPLVSPDDLKAFRCRLKSQTKTAHAGEKLHGPDDVHKAPQNQLGDTRKHIP